MKSLLNIFILLIGLASPFSLAAAEYKKFIGVQSVSNDTELDYLDGKEDYEFSNVRLQIGADFDVGAVVGIEFISGDEDETLDPFGTPYRLEIIPAFGVFINAGDPVYVRIGYSVWGTEYTNLTTDVVEKENVATIEYGLGVRFNIGKNLAVYADYTKRNSTAEFPSQFIGQGNLEFDSELVAAGVSFSF